MYKKEYFSFYGFLGIGQFGGNVTKKFEEVGYPCVVANSSVEDLSTRNAKNKLHFRNGNGCHKDRRKSKALLKENLEMLIDEVRSKMPEITTLFICASSAGGTGSGMLAAVAKILSSQLGINICIVTVLPSRAENFQSYANTIELFQEIEKLKDCIGATFILDNSKHNDKLKINEIFFTHLNTFLANKNGGDYGCLDRSEIDKLLSIPGMSIISILGKDNSNKLLSSVTSNNIYAPIESNKVVKYVGLMSCNKSVETSELYSQIGTPIDTYIGTMAPSNVCMIAGLTLPKTRLNEIKSMAQTNMEIIKKGIDAANDSLFEDSLDFLGAFETKKKPIKEEKVSSMDIMNEFL